MMERGPCIYAPVHCRTGSLEKWARATPCRGIVHCRTGSLENLLVNSGGPGGVHCRTGSLERYSVRRVGIFNVHCRTGSIHTTIVLDVWSCNDTLNFKPLALARNNNRNNCDGNQFSAHKSMLY